MEMTTVKTVAVFAIIFGCFAVLYPKIFHPMLAHLFATSPKKQMTDDMLNRAPPHLRQPSHAQVRSETPMDDIGRHMRPGPHPGLRAAAEMKKQATTQGVGGKGIMSVVLPMYAVGIVIYLIYTLSKVFGKKDKPPEGELLTNNPFAEIRYDADKKKFTYGNEDEDDDSDPEMRQFKRKRSKQKDLERLLLKADEKHLSELEMAQLKKRLMETESQMNRILQAMECMQERVDNTSESLSKVDGEVFKRSVDSSPDMESYEIVTGNTEAEGADIEYEDDENQFDYSDVMADDKEVENIGMHYDHIDIRQRKVGKVRPVQSDSFDSENSLNLEEQDDENVPEEGEHEEETPNYKFLAREVEDEEEEEEELAEEHVEDIPAAKQEDPCETEHADLRKRIPKQDDVESKD